MSNQGMTVRVHNCSACGTDHDVIFVPMDREEQVNSITVTHMGMCNQTGTIVYMGFGLDPAADKST